MRRKKITACILVAVLLIGALYIVQRLLVPKYQTGIVEGSMVEEYYKDRSDHEVLFVGDCEVYENFSTIELWRKYGITSYIRGSAQQLTWQSYYLLEDALKHETPKVVVFNVLALKYNEPQSEAYNRMSIDGMKWSMSKVNDIKASMTDEENFVDYIFPLLRYHSRWSELTKDDVKHIFSKDKVTHNGYYMRVDTKPQQEFPDPTPLTDYKLGDKAMGYLQKMTDLCKEKGVKLVLIKAPTEYPYWYEQWDEQVQQFADENDVDVGKNVIYYLKDTETEIQYGPAVSDKNGELSFTIENKEEGQHRYSLIVDKSSVPQEYDVEQVADHIGFNLIFDGEGYIVDENVIDNQTIIKDYYSKVTNETSMEYTCFITVGYKLIEDNTVDFRVQLNDKDDTRKALEGAKYNINIEWDINGVTRTKTIKERQTNTSGNLSTRIVKADQVRIYVQQVGASAGYTIDTTTQEIYLSFRNNGLTNITSQSPYDRGQTNVNEPNQGAYINGGLYINI